MTKSIHILRRLNVEKSSGKTGKKYQENMGFGLNCM
jgi:hypothetical protein